MANLSELSVAIALRDWQWKNKIIDANQMELFVPLTGKPDQLMGDLLVEPNDRLLLLEVKSLEKQIPSEWRKKTFEVKEGDGTSRQERRAKNAYEFLRSALFDKAPHGAPADSPKLREFCRISLAGHHFLYWDPQAKNGLTFGALMVEPYLLAIERTGGFKATHGIYGTEASSDPGLIEKSAQFVQTKFSLGLRTSEYVEAGRHLIDYKLVTPFEVGMVYSEAARLIEASASVAGENDWFYIGLEPMQFKNYVQDLCRGLDPEIRVVISSLSGKIFAYAENVSELLQLIKKIKVRAKPEAAPAGAYRARSGYEAAGNSTPSPARKGGITPR